MSLKQVLNCREGFVLFGGSLPSSSFQTTEIDSAMNNPTYIQEMPTNPKIHLLWLLKDFIATDFKRNVRELFISVTKVFISYWSHSPKP